MLEDRILVWKLNRGSPEALGRIYAKYREYLLTIAAGLLHEKSGAEDIVHDVFVEFARSARDFRLTGSLRGYLAVLVANRTRNFNRAAVLRKGVSLDDALTTRSTATDPQQWAIYSEDFIRLNDALAELPYEQKEVVMLHIHGKLKFREIAKVQGTSSKTVESRYRYGLDKLRSILDREVPK